MPKCARNDCSNLVTANRKWCAESCRKKAQRSGQTAPLASSQRIAQLLADNGIDPSDIGTIEKVKVSEWGNGQTAASIVLSPRWAEGPKWPVVQPAKPTVVKVALPKRADNKRGWRTAVVLPDPQIGYRRLADGTLDPFHDERAISVALKIVAEIQPDLIINLGDLLDFPSFGKYVQEPSFAQTTQAAIDRAHAFLASQRALSPHAEIRLLEGNHDIRLQNSIIANASAAFGIQRANAPESWPVLSVPHLLRLDELRVDYVGGYPNGRTWINDRLACSHGPSKLKSGGSSALASLDDERVSVIAGHTHRIEMAHKTRNVRDGFKQNFVAAIGCLSRIDGAVPSTRGSIDPLGRPVVHYEDWQQGLAVVSYKSGDGDFGLEIVPIIEGAALFRGQRVAA